MKRGNVFFTFLFIMFMITFVVGSDAFLRGEPRDDVAVRMNETFLNISRMGEGYQTTHTFGNYDNPNFMGDKLGRVVNKTLEALVFVGVEMSDAGLYYGYEYHPDPQTVGFWTLAVVVGSAVVPMVWYAFVLFAALTVFVYDWAKDRKKKNGGSIL